MTEGTPIWGLLRLRAWLLSHFMEDLRQEHSTTELAPEKCQQWQDALASLVVELESLPDGISIKGKIVDDARRMAEIYKSWNNIPFGPETRPELAVPVRRHWWNRLDRSRRRWSSGISRHQHRAASLFDWAKVRRIHNTLAKTAYALEPDFPRTAAAARRVEQICQPHW